MIKLEFSAALALYLSFYVIIVLMLWIFSWPKVKERKFIQDERNIWHCQICDYTYIDSVHEEISSCPRCDSFIERQKTAEGVK